MALPQTTPNPQTTGKTLDFLDTMNALKRAGGKADGLLSALRRLKLEMGGYTVDFSGGGNVGSGMVDFAVVDRSGNLKY